MTRKEEIQNEATFMLYHGEIKEAKDFITGAEWADKTMIDKACDWLRSEAKYYWGTEEDIDEMLEDFRKVMEE